MGFILGLRKGVGFLRSGFSAGARGWGILAREKNFYLQAFFKP